jgi:hypothetical protein
LATPENISKSYISRILRLAMLAPGIVESIIAGRPEQRRWLPGGRDRLR